MGQFSSRTEANTMAEFQVSKIPLFLLKSAGNLTCIAFLMLADLLQKILIFITNQSVNLLTLLTQAEIAKDKIPLPSQRLQNSEVVYEKGTNIETGGEPQFIDVDETFKNVKFPFTNDELIEKAKEVLLAEDFQFVFPFVGPLNKTEFIKIFSSFKLNSSFPDSNNNYFGFTVDPTEPNRVWFMSRPKMTHGGTLRIGALIIEPSGTKVEPPPQVLSLSFDNDGKCYKFTGGYSVDRTIGNTDGLGGVFGIVHALGKNLPFPEAHPWQASFRWQVFYKRIPQLQADFNNLWSK